MGNSKKPGSEGEGGDYPSRGPGPPRAGLLGAVSLHPIARLVGLLSEPDGFDMACPDTKLVLLLGDTCHCTTNISLTVGFKS